jgi:hypothetical protein
MDGYRSERPEAGKVYLSLSVLLKHLKVLG